MKIDYEKYKDIKIDKEKFKDIPTNVEQLRNCLAICYVLMEDKDKEIERLRSIINKAINKTKDIEFSITGKDFNYYLKLKDIEQGKELLQILKGSDKE